MSMQLGWVFVGTASYVSLNLASGCRMWDVERREGEGTTQQEWISSYPHCTLDPFQVPIVAV